jgi:adenylate cyclase
MDDKQTNRRLAAILAADVVGYSRLMGEDEAGTLAALKWHRENEFDPPVSRYRGRIVKLIGDGTLVEFTSVVDAVNCAMAIQQAVGTAAATAGPRIVLRIGINLGDIIIDGDDIYGDGVNIAARLEPLARPGGICVSSIVNESVGGRTGATFNDGGEIRVKNIDRPIRVWQWHPSDASTTEEQAPAAPATPAAEGMSEAPSIAVLPFENMSGDVEQEYFSDGISEDIITDLSKVSGLLVIARNSSFAYKGKSIDLRTVGRDLGVSTVLEGSVRRAGNRVRITAQLIDAATGGHLWAERYDRDLTDIFAVQDEVTLKIVDALKVTLTPSEMAEIAGAGTKSVEAHDSFLRARSLIMSQNLNATLYKRAVEYGERAIELDPGYAQAYAGLALSHVFDFHNRWSDDPDGALFKAASLAARAAELDPNDPVAHHAVSVSARWMKDHKRAAAAVEKALALNPNFAIALFTRGLNMIFAGQPKEAIPDIERAIRLDPGFSQQYLHYLGMAHLLLGNDETAALMFRERLLLAQDTDIGRALLAATLGHLGEIEVAQQTWKDLMKINPSFSFEERLARMPFADRSDASRIVEGLTKAGLPD